MGPLKNNGFDSCVALNTTSQVLHICLIFTLAPKKARQALGPSTGLNREEATSKDLKMVGLMVLDYRVIFITITMRHLSTLVSQ